MKLHVKLRGYRKWWLGQGTYLVAHSINGRVDWYLTMKHLKVVAIGRWFWTPRQRWEAVREVLALSL
jgi:hypothetical protein